MPRVASFSPFYSPSKNKWGINIPDPKKTYGKQKRRGSRTTYFKTQAEAEAFSKSLKKAREVGISDLASIDAVKCARLDQADYRAGMMGFDSIEDLLDHVESRNLGSSNTLTISHLLENYRRIKEKNWNDDDNRSASSFNSAIKPLKDLMDQPANRLDLDFWIDFKNQLIDDDTVNPTTINRMFMYLRSSYKYYHSQGLLKVNPITSIEKISITKAEPAVISPDDLKKFLAWSVKYTPRSTGYFALIFFMGARPFREACNIRWEHIDWKKNEIQIVRPDRRKGVDGKNRNPRGYSKTKSTRFVRMEPNLREWLLPLRREEGLIAPSMDNADKASHTKIRKDREYISGGKFLKEPRKLIDWAFDISRHSYGSYFEAANSDENNCAELIRKHMGHQSLRTYNDHYKNSVHESKGLEYFGISPDRKQQKALKDWAQNNYDL